MHPYQFKDRFCEYSTAGQHTPRHEIEFLVRMHEFIIDFLRFPDVDMDPELRAKLQQVHRTEWETFMLYRAFEASGKLRHPVTLQHAYKAMLLDKHSGDKDRHFLVSAFYVGVLKHEARRIRVAENWVAAYRLLPSDVGIWAGLPIGYNAVNPPRGSPHYDTTVARHEAARQLVEKVTAHRKTLAIASGPAVSEPTEHTLVQLDLDPHMDLTVNQAEYEHSARRRRDLWWKVVNPDPTTWSGRTVCIQSDSALRGAAFASVLSRAAWSRRTALSSLRSLSQALTTHLHFG